MSLRRQHGLLLLIAVVVSATYTWQKTNITASTLRLDPVTTLGSCTPVDQRYAKLFFGNLNIETWPENYHQTVESILDEYTTNTQEIACLEDNIFPVQEKSALYGLASKLPPWEESNKLADLQRNDVGFVLLEFLRIYECAMLDRKNFTSLYVQERYAEEQQAGNIPANQELRYDRQRSETEKELRIIEEELATARPTLEKTLLIITGSNRLSVLDAELQCLQRASLDIRNALSLAADTSSCLPRIWNNKDVLRNLAQ